MQEEVTQRTVALCVEATKLSAGMLQQAMKKVLDEMQKEVTGHKTKLHHGKQTLRQLMSTSIRSWRGPPSEPLRCWGKRTSTMCSRLCFPIPAPGLS